MLFNIGNDRLLNRENIYLILNAKRKSKRISDLIKKYKMAGALHVESLDKAFSYILYKKKGRMVIYPSPFTAKTLVAKFEGREV